jgi:ribonucleotide monophosphatase NagD (HAD superfamily)
MPNYPEPDPGIPIVAIDLDGTIAYGQWPLRGVIGKPIPEGIAALRHYAEKGYRVILCTARPKIDEALIWEWIQQHSLPVDEVVTARTFAGLYVDDRGWRPPWAPTPREEPSDV